MEMVDYFLRTDMEWQMLEVLENIEIPLRHELKIIGEIYEFNEDGEEVKKEGFHANLRTYGRLPWYVEDLLPVIDEPKNAFAKFA